MGAWLMNLGFAASGVTSGAVPVTYDRRLTRQRYGGLWAVVLLLLAGCAHVRPIPCEEMETATANGGRNYAWLCP